MDTSCITRTRHVFIIFILCISSIVVVNSIPLGAKRLKSFVGQGVRFDTSNVRTTSSSKTTWIPKIQKIRSLGCPTVVPIPKNVDPGSRFFVHAVIDHFSNVDTMRCTWNQRYYVNATSCRRDDCPVFLYVGGEGPLSPLTVAGSLFMSELAEVHGALVVALEHRYFGFSWPTETADSPNLKAYGFDGSEQL